jgi:hypothetical protein
MQKLGVSNIDQAENTLVRARGHRPAKPTPKCRGVRDTVPRT